MQSEKRVGFSVERGARETAPTSWAGLEPRRSASPCGADEALGLVRRWVGFVVGATVLGGLAALAWSWLQAPVYRAYGALEVLDQDRDFLGASGVSPTRAGGPAASRAGLATHARILGSRSLTAKTLAVLQETDRGSQDGQGAVLAETLQVRTPGETYILEMQVDSTDPAQAAAFLNTLAEVYIEENLQARWNAVRETEVWLERQLGELQEKLEASQERLQDYARRSGLLFVSSEESVAEQRLQQLQGELSRAEADRIAKQSDFESIEVGLGVGAADAPRVANLREYERRLTELRTELADLDAMFTPEHPKVKRVAAQIAEMEGSVARERSALLEQLGGDYESAVRRQELLAENYETQAGVVSDHAVKLIRYDILRREVDTNQELYDGLLKRVKETAVASALNAGNVRVLDRAQVPTEPIGPNHVVHAVMGGMLGGFVGLVFALVRVRVDSTLRGPADVAQWLQSPELGAIPAAGRRLLGDGAGRRSVRLRVRYSGQGNGALTPRRVSPPQFVVERLAEASDFSPMAEGVRAALTSVLFAKNGAGNTVLAVTSPSAEDGKTTIASNLAISLARIGTKTLLIDADLRRPRLHEVFGVKNEIGLLHLLGSVAGGQTAGLRRAVQATSIDGLFVLPSGSDSVVSADSVYSKRLGLLLEGLRREYGVILMDTPPMMQIADARVLAQVADATVLVVRAGRTTRAVARNAEERLTRDGTRVLGVVLNGWAPLEGVDGYYKYPPRAVNDTDRSMAAAAS